MQNLIPAKRPTSSTPDAGNSKAAYFERPPLRISLVTVQRLLRAGVDPRVARVDLEVVKLELQRVESWSQRRALIAEVEYKRFLSLHLWNRNLSYPLVPTVLIDDIWHKHILDTRAYCEDMVMLFGSYLHHFPYLGFIGKESKRLKEQAFDKFCELYEWTFGESHLHSLVALCVGSENACEEI